MLKYSVSLWADISPRNWLKGSTKLSGKPWRPARYRSSNTTSKCPVKGLRFYESRMMKSGDLEVMAIIRDVTEHRLSERQVRESLREKEVLLKEIHHRVKNNMQVISSLIALQGEQPGGAEHREVFNDIKNRVRTMALVHETLYRSENLAMISLRDYIGSLRGHIEGSYLVGGEGVTITGRVDDISIDIDRAIPVGLIINELLDQRAQVRVSRRKER